MNGDWNTSICVLIRSCCRKKNRTHDLSIVSYSSLKIQISHKTVFLFIRVTVCGLWGTWCRYVQAIDSLWWARLLLHISNDTSVCFLVKSRKSFLGFFHILYIKCFSSLCVVPVSVVSMVVPSIGYVLF